MFFPRWEKPSPEVIKLNTDAAFLDNAVVLSVVVRDENGLILMARTKKVPSLISVAAQLLYYERYSWSSTTSLVLLLKVIPKCVTMLLLVIMKTALGQLLISVLKLVH